MVFKWSERSWMPNGQVFNYHLNTRQPDHLNTRQMDAILFSYVLVLYSNCWSSHRTKHINDHFYTKPFEQWTSKSWVFKWSVFRSQLYLGLPKYNQSGSGLNMFHDYFVLNKGYLYPLILLYLKASCKYIVQFKK